MLIKSYDMSHTSHTPDEILARVAHQMREQQQGYARLESIARNLSAQLVGGTPEAIEIVVKAGDAELLKMRSRLFEIMNSLTAFAEARRTNANATMDESAATATLSHERRAEFETASNALLNHAREFARLARQISALARNGSSFTSAHIEFYGIQPTTYRAPYAPNTRGTTATAVR